MLNARNLEESPRGRQYERQLWHDGRRNMHSLGCGRCPDRSLCGGLQIAGALFDCLDLCCGQQDSCDLVCRRRPDDFARRVREVGGFGFDNVPRAPKLVAPILPGVVPMLFHGNSRRNEFGASATVCLSLYNVIQRHDGRTRYSSKIELANAFRISPTAQVVLTGTAVDPPLERWWSLGPQRRNVIRALRELGISFVTTPNFSVLADRPRWDDLHSMKRIALVHQEFLSGGLPAALHVNARTDRDWDRWSDYIAKRPEVTHVCFEFATGADRAERVDWYANQLLRLAASVGRPLHLVLRGGGKILSALVRGFSAITFLDTSAFQKTAHRQQATTSATGKVIWRSLPTEQNEPLDHLLTENWHAVETFYATVIRRPVASLGANG